MKAKTFFLDFKGQAALLIIVSLFAKIREAGQSVFQTDIVSTNGDDNAGLIEVFLRGLIPPSRIEAEALDL